MPGFLEYYMNTSIGKGERNSALFFATKCAIEDGLSESDIWDRVGDKARSDGLSDKEIEHTIRSALSKPADFRYKKENRQYRSSTTPIRIRPQKAAPFPTIPDDWEQTNFSDYLYALYQPADLVNYVIRAVDRGDGWKPCDSGITERVDALIPRLHGRRTADVIDINPASGAWVRINPCDGKGISDDNIIDYRHCLVESDKIGVEEQWRIVTSLNIPCATVVFSGGKSLHFVVKIHAGQNRKLYDDRVQQLYSVLDRYGFHVDTNNKHPSRLSRLPGIWRGRQKQVLLATNIGCESWQEWVIQPRAANIARWVGTEPPIQRFVFKGILPEGAICGIDAKGGLGKGWITQTLIMSACTGKTLLETFIPDGPMKVLWLESEDPESELHRRFKKIAAAYEFTEWDLHRCSENLIAFPGQSFPLTRPAGGSVEPTEHYEWVYGKVKEYQPRLIVLDPRSHYYGGDENDNTQVGRFMGLLKELTSAVDKGAAVWVNHHTSKEREQQISSASGRGASAGRDAQRVLFGLSGMTLNEVQGFKIHDPHLYVRMENTKSNWTERYSKVIWLKRETGDLGGVLKQVDLSRTEELK